VNDDDTEEIGRRLRETGHVSAPDHVRREVMRRVRAEPRRTFGRRLGSAWRPALTAAAAAVVLGGAVVGLAQLGAGDGGAGGDAASGGGAVARESAGGASEQPGATSGGAAPNLDAGTDGGQQLFRDKAMTLTVPRLAAERILARRLVGDTVVIRVPRARFQALTASLRDARRATTAKADDVRVRLVAR
jgi:hypothetical protein